MLSIGKMKNPRYYLKFTRYYLEGGEKTGRWIGRGAERLGLTNAVRPRHFKNVFQGLSPSGEPLVRNVNGKKRCAGWDLTFSAPKGVSVLWAVGPKRVRRAIERCHDRAVRRALRFLETDILSIRRGKQGTQQFHSEMVAALFQHSSTRLCDPALHTHALIFNSGFAGIRWNAIDGRQLYSWKMALGAIYRTELVHLLWKTLRLPFERIKTWVEVKGIVPERALKFFSKRSEELRRAMQLYGTDSARASDIANLRTRTAKRNVPRPELFRQWRREARAFEFGPKQVVEHLKSRRAAQSAESDAIPEQTIALLKDTVRSCVQEIMDRQAHFSRRELIVKFLSLVAEDKIPADLALQIVDQALSVNDDIIPVGKVRGEKRFTTRKNIANEEAILKLVNELKSKAGRPTPKGRIQAASQQVGDLAPEQSAAVHYVLDGASRIKALVGGPGTGKTRSLAVAAEACKQSGRRMIGCAPSGKASRNLEEKSGIKSSTVRRMQIRLDKAAEAERIAKAEQSIAADIFGLPTYPLHQLHLDANTFVVVDEAGMVDTADTLDLLNRVSTAGATLILVGDENQLPPIGAGAPFDAIKKQFVHAALTEIRRFNDPDDKEALRLICDGKPQLALEKFRERDLLFLGENRHEARQQLINDWTANGGIDRPQDHIALVATNAERQHLNDAFQKLRQDRGIVDKQGQLIHGELIARGDRVMFLKNDLGLQVNNGDIGTVTTSRDVSSSALTVSLDRGQTVTLSLDRYDHITRAYAATVHKFQGADVPNTYALLGGSMQSMEFTYTQLSRHQQSCRLYTDKIEAGEKLERLCRQIGTPSRECLAIELMAQDPPKPSAPGDAKLPESRLSAAISLASPPKEPTAPKLDAPKEFPNSATSSLEPTASSVADIESVQVRRSSPTGVLLSKQATVGEDRANGLVTPQRPVENPPAILLPTEQASRQKPDQVQTAWPESQSPPPQTVPVKTSDSRQHEPKHETKRDVYPPKPHVEQRPMPRATQLVEPIANAPPDAERGPLYLQPVAPQMVGVERQEINVIRDKPLSTDAKPATSSSSPEVPSNPAMIHPPAIISEHTHGIACPDLRFPRAPDNRSDFRDPQAFDLTDEQLTPIEGHNLSRRLIEAGKSFDAGAEQQRPRLYLVVSNDRPTIGQNAPAARSTATTVAPSDKRISESFLEGELRIARQLAETQSHEHKINPPIDPPRSGPKPS